MKTSVSRTLFIALSGASLVAIATAGSANADRKRAPIVYAGQGQTQGQSQPTQTAPQAQAPASAKVTEGRRVEFRYPDQPDTFYSPQGARSASNADSPIAFASAESAQAAQEYMAPKDPAISAGGFDARAAAANVAAKRAEAPSQPIRIASVQVQKPANTGKPLTLSRVSVNRDAPVGEERGRAGIYIEGFDGQPTANGEIFDETAMTAAHPSLPLPSLVQVINEDNGREVVVRVNDRGPFDGKRILELSPRAGNVLGVNKGKAANVRVRYLGPAPVAQNNAAYASSDVEDESMPPVAVPAPQPQTVAYTQPSVAARQPAVTMAASAPTGLGNVYIQAGSFSDIANAQSLTAALGRGLSVKIEEARVNGGDYFRVLIGPFQTREQANIQRSQLSNAGIVDGFLTTR